MTVIISLINIFANKYEFKDKNSILIFCKIMVAMIMVIEYTLISKYKNYTIDFYFYRLMNKEILFHTSRT